MKRWLITLLVLALWTASSSPAQVVMRRPIVTVSSGIVKGDTFTDTADVLLENHTPTGPNAGTSWIVQVASGVIKINASNQATENNASNGNRYRMSDDLGSDQMDVQGVFTTGGLVGTGPGVLGRCSTGGGGCVEFWYDNGAGQWNLTDGTTSTTFTEAWPGGSVTMKLQIRTGLMKGFVGGVEKVSLSSNLLSGNNRAGIILLNFDSVTVTALTVDDFIATAF